MTHFQEAYCEEAVLGQTLRATCLDSIPVQGWIFQKLGEKWYF